MDLLEDPTFKNKYQKNKLRVKRWENDFKEKYGRKPNKDDIRAADASIRDSYKAYYNLKTQALEETLLDITFPDESLANVTANTSSDSSLNSSVLQDSMSLDKTQPEPSAKNVENIDPEKPERIIGNKQPKESFSCSVSGAENPNVEGAWNSSLRQEAEENPQKRRSLIIGRSSSFQLSQKMFSSSSLTKRNPRKSLSMSKPKSSKSELTVTSSATTNDRDDDFDAKTMFGEPVKLVQVKAKVSAQPISALQQLIKGGTIATVNRSINQGWLERCEKDNKFEPVTYNPQRLSGTSDSGVESMDLSDPSAHENTPAADTTVDFSDSEDFIYNSESEDEERRHKRIRNLRKSVSDSTFGEKPTKRQRFDDDFSAVIQTPLADTKSSIGLSEAELPVRKPLAENREYPRVEESQDTMKKPEKPRGIVEKSLAVKKTEEKPVKVANDPETKVKKGRKTRVTRERVKNPVKTREKKPRKCAPRKKAEDVEEEPSNDEIVDNSPEIPDYGIEATEVVPRFAMPSDATGDLIDDFSRSFTADKTQAIATVKPKKSLSAREKLEQKIASGKINENFVRINLKKKVFVRGKRNFNGSRYRKNQWKQRKKELGSGEGSLDLADLAEKSGGACFKCGEKGHFAQRCPAAKSEGLLPNVDEEEPSNFLTLDEVEKMAAKSAVVAHCSRIESLPKCASMSQEPQNSKEFSDEEDYSELFDDDFDEEISQEQTQTPRLQGHKIPEDLLAKLLPPSNGTVEPIYRPVAGEQIPETPDSVFQALRKFGHEHFRPGQEKAIMRILSGQSTLVTLSTGSGKSLCYQLPAYIYAKKSKCITLVVSPLVSLMDDQVVGVPKFLSAAALHTGQTPKVKEQIMETIKAGKLDILLVSPEAVVAGEKSTGFGSLFRQLPPIAFACIDEAHCISQWSHNFRPSYLMICRVLMEKLGVKTILGLTATATKKTAQSIVHHLKIHDGMDGVISDIPMPKNLTLTVSKDEQRDRALVDLVLSERFRDCDSIIVYCTRRDECSRIAGILRISLQDPKKPVEMTKSKCSIHAEAYHAGLTSSRRKVIQKSFMNGDTRIVVATVAFGMGINKSNIRSVIHYNMPASFEGYVQEVGRAGRDNLPAHCHLFLSPSRDFDKLELRRHIFANGVDRHMIRRLLQKVFVPCSCPRVDADRSTGRRCPGHEVAIPIAEMVRSLDITEETISTLLCYLELHPKRLITVLSSVYTNAKVSSYGGPRALKLAAQTSPPLAMAIALDMKRGISHENSSFVEFPVVDIAAAIGWDSGVVKNHLKNLEWQNVDGRSKRSAISVHYDVLGLRVRAPGDLTDAELDEALEALADRAKTQEISALRQLETIHASLNKFSNRTVQNCLQLNDETLSKSESLKEIIREYFRSDTPLSIVEISPENEPANEGHIMSDVQALIFSYRDNNFTGRAVARIFHGIQSPNYSALTWSRCRFWRSHLETDFNFICRIATREILAMR